MRLEKNQLIAGVPAKDVRRFMRRAAGFIIRPRTVTHVLGFPEDDARRLVRKFEFKGWLRLQMITGRPLRKDTHLRWRLQRLP